MKCFAVVTILILAAGSAFAFPGFEPTYFPAEMKAVAAELGPRTIGDLKVSELIPVVERLDVARQKDGYVMMAGGMSMFWPGAGQYMAGDWVDGTLFTGLHLGVTAGSLFWAHSLLPSDLQWSNLDYFSASRSTVKGRWDSHSFNEYLPAVGALAVGGAVGIALRVWSARNAQEVAKTRIDDGKITFEPRFENTRWGMGLGMGMRF